MPKFKCDILSNFQTMLPDRSVLIGQKLMESAKMPKFKWDILGDFQTLCMSRKCVSNVKNRNEFLWLSKMEYRTDIECHRRNKKGRRRSAKRWDFEKLLTVRYGHIRSHVVSSPLPSDELESTTVLAGHGAFGSRRFRWSLSAFGCKQKWYVVVYSSGE